MEEVWVVSLGGSRIVPDDVDWKFLKEFRDLIDRHRDKKFVVVCGGGRTARRYMTALKRLGKNTKRQSMEGIAVTRLHAGFMARFFALLDSKHRTGQGVNREIPFNMKKVGNLLRKNRVVFCGALRWRDKNTSDGTAAKLAGFLGCSFINLTNVAGLYDKDPKKNKKAKFISKISWKDFLKVARKVKFEAGQHFVLDIVAAEEIAKKRIVTYIVGSLDAMNEVLVLGDDYRKASWKRFSGTVIRG
jgi:uridylate kinase